LTDEVLLALTLRARGSGKSVEDEVSEIISGAIENSEIVNATGCGKRADSSVVSVSSSMEAVRDPRSNEHSVEFMLGL
jgi:hypothetical protein